MNIKRNGICCLLLVCLAMVSGCQKEKEFVNLKAVIGNPSKVFINDSRYPCWNEGDVVKINGNEYEIEVDNANPTCANISNVEVADHYCAVYPADILNSYTNNTMQVTLSKRQIYTTFGSDNRQKVEVPMGAYINNGTTLQFHNLCSIVRVTVENDIPTSDAKDNVSMDILEINIAADGTILSGSGEATITTSEDNDYIAISSGDKHVTLSCQDRTEPMVTLSAYGDEASFDIVVPQFGTATNGDNVTISVKCATGVQTFRATNVHLEHNSIVPITLEVDNLTPMRAELVSGSVFNSHIPSGVTAVRFEYGVWDVSSVELQTDDSPTKIYGRQVGTEWVVSTPAESIIANRECQNMFNNQSGLTSIDFGDHFNAENVTNMYQMFHGCSSLTSLDLSKLDTRNVTNMEALFDGCSSMSSLTLIPNNSASFTTASVTNMKFMFRNCSTMTSIPLSGFNTGNVLTMREMFSGCRGLTSLDLSDFNTSNVGTGGGDDANFDMYCMFKNCSNLTSLDLSSLNTSNVRNMEFMFDGCSRLQNISFCTSNTGAKTGSATFTTSNVRKITGMFRGCRALSSLDLSSFSFNSNLTILNQMFKDCSGLTTLDLTSFNTGNVQQMKEMFSGCTSLSSIYLSTGFSTSSLSNLENMFYNIAKTIHDAAPTATTCCTVYCASTVLANYFETNRSTTTAPTWVEFSSSASK